MRWRRPFDAPCPRTHLPGPSKSCGWSTPTTPWSHPPRACLRSSVCTATRPRCSQPWTKIPPVPLPLPSPVVAVEPGPELELHSRRPSADTPPQPTFAVFLLQPIRWLKRFGYLPKTYLLELRAGSSLLSLWVLSLYRRSSIQRR